MPEETTLVTYDKRAVIMALIQACRMEDDLPRSSYALFTAGRAVAALEIIGALLADKHERVPEELLMKSIDYIWYPPTLRKLNLLAPSSKYRFLSALERIDAAERELEGEETHV